MRVSLFLPLLPSLSLFADKVDAKGTFTYWLNKLQGQPLSLDLFETLNPLPGTIDESCVLHRCQMVSLCDRCVERDMRMRNSPLREMRTLAEKANCQIIPKYTERCSSAIIRNNERFHSIQSQR